MWSSWQKVGPQDGSNKKADPGGETINGMVPYFFLGHHASEQNSYAMSYDSLQLVPTQSNTMKPPKSCKRHPILTRSTGFSMVLLFKCSNIVASKNASTVGR